MYIVRYEVITQKNKTEKIEAEFTRPEQASNFYQAMLSGPRFVSDDVYTVNVDTVAIFKVEEYKVYY